MYMLKRMGFQHIKIIVITVGALIIPLAVLALGVALHGNTAARLTDPVHLLSNWLYMATPHLLVMSVAAAIRSTRRQFLPCSLIALSLALVAFQCWVWWLVPPRESGLAWVLYIPLAIVVLVSAAVFTICRQGSNLS